MVIYHLKKAKVWCMLAVLSASLLAPMQTKAQRVAVKTNALYWAASTPNLGAEFRVNRHVTFNFEAAYNRIKVFNIDTRGAMITPEVRYWFSARPQTGHFVGIAGIGCHYNYVRGAIAIRATSMVEALPTATVSCCRDDGVLRRPLEWEWLTCRR